MRPLVAVIGAGSFLAKDFLQRFPTLNCVGFTHQEIGKAEIPDSISIAVNFTRHQDQEIRELKLEELPENAICDWLAERNIHLLQLSSRRVYAPSPAPLSESSRTGGMDLGGVNKLKGEEILLSRLPSGRVTILRLTNIFGLEVNCGRRSFFSTALKSLKETGTINLDLALDTQKDFLPVSHFSHVLFELTQRPMGGVFNVGAGFSLGVGEVCQLMCAGFGKGSVSTCGSRRDDFWIDCRKMATEYGVTISREDVKSAVFKIGWSLAND